MMGSMACNAVTRRVCSQKVVTRRQGRAETRCHRAVVEKDFVTARPACDLIRGRRSDDDREGWSNALPFGARQFKDVEQ